MGKKTKVRVFSTSVWRALLVQTDKPTRTTVHRVMLLWLATVSRGPVRHTTHNTHTHAHIHTHPPTHICSNTHTHTQTQMHTCKQTHTHAHTHTHTHLYNVSLCCLTSAISQQTIVTVQNVHGWKKKKYQSTNVWNFHQSVRKPTNQYVNNYRTFILVEQKTSDRFDVRGRGVTYCLLESLGNFPSFVGFAFIKN